MPKRKPRPPKQAKTNAATVSSILHGSILMIAYPYLSQARAAKSRPTAKALPGASKPAPPTGISAAPARATAAPALAPAMKVTPKPTAPMLNGAAKATPRAAPPPPPAPPARAAPSDKDMYKALYNFQGQEGEMNLTKGELVEVKTKDDNGKHRAISRVTANKPLSRLVLQVGGSSSRMVRKVGHHRTSKSRFSMPISCGADTRPSGSLKMVPKTAPRAAAPPPPPPPPQAASSGASMSAGLAPALAQAIHARSGGSGASTPASSRPASVVGKPKPAVPSKPPAPKIPSKPSTGGSTPAAPAAAPAARGIGQLDLSAA